MSMTPEQLMAPRWEVIADYPGSQIPIGTIIEVENEFYRFGDCPFHTGIFKRYKHLFKPLEWWERRTTDQLPKYVSERCYNTDVIHKVDYYEWKDGKGPVCNGIHYPFFSILPATESEYLEYQKQNNGHN